MPAYIVGSGTFLPERAVTNEALAPQLGISPAQILKSTGILRRQVGVPRNNYQFVATAALRAALQDATWQPQEIDDLIFGTMTPDRFVPGSACEVQQTLGVGEVPCLDIRAACCNAVYGLQLAAALIANRAAKRIALCLAEVQSHWLDLSLPRRISRCYLGMVPRLC